MKLSRQTSAIGTEKPTRDPGSAPLLPHEADQAPDSQEEHAPRRVGKQAQRDVQRGLEDTDRRGGEEYQGRTQNDAHANVNSKQKQKRGR